MTPWGLAQHTQWTAILAAVGLVLLKLLVFVMVLALIETTLAKLRLFRISGSALMGVPQPTSVTGWY
ncbi:MAG: hypothetical protein ACYCQM_02515 [Acidithiobacillus sp.]